MDILAAHHLKEAILLALLRRNQTGDGDFLEVSLLQAAVSSLANQATNWLVAGVKPQKQGSAHPNIAPYGDIFRTLDGHEILLAIGSDRQFNSLCEILSLDGANEMFQTNVLRVKNRPALNQLISQSTGLLLLNTLVFKLQAANIPYGIIKNMEKVFETPEVESLLLRSDDRTGVRTYLGNSFRDGRSHFPPPPHLGEHSKEILIQSLAIPAQEVNSLIESGIII